MVIKKTGFPLKIFVLSFLKMKLIQANLFISADLPCIMSGSQLGFLDPRQKCFGDGNPGKSWKLKSKRLQRNKDQLKPFEHQIFHVNDEVFQKGQYPATVFRFPLRTEESELSKTIYDNTRVKELFASYEDDAEISLLFLKSVQSVSLYVKEGNDEPRLEYRVRIVEDDVNNITSERAIFVDGCKAMINDVRSDTDFRIETFTGSESKISRYLTLNLLKLDGISEELKDLVDDETLKLLPWVSVTVPVNDIKIDGPISTSPKGRVFCFLPLPTDASPDFPVHVHGYFGLNDNRRGIKWPDGESSNDRQAQWNERLIHEVFPDAYAKLLLQIINTSDLKAPEEIYRCWPNVDITRHDIWQKGLVELVKLLENEQILYSDINGGRWCAPKDVLLNNEDDSLLSGLIQKAMLRKGHSVVKVPKHVLQLLESGNVKMKIVTPQHVRNAIRGDSLNWLADEEKVQLLNYVVSDGRVNDLSDIHLLPLQDGTFTCFSKSHLNVYIPTEEVPSIIIPNLDHRFTAETLPELLRSEDTSSSTQLLNFSAEHVLGLLNESLPRNWVTGPDSKVPWNPGENGHPGEKWLSDMWSWLSRNYRKLPMEKLQNIPLLPIQERPGCNKHLVRLQKNTIIFKTSTQPGTDSIGNEQNIPQSICSFLETLEFAVIDNNLPEFIADHPETDRLIQPATPQGVCEILVAKKKLAIKKMKDLSGTERTSFREFLSDLPHHAIDHHRDFLIQLPLFPNTCKSFVSVVHCKRIIPDDFHKIPVTHFKDTFILWQDESSKAFLMKLGCREVLEEELLRAHILPHVSQPNGCYDADETLSLLEWVLIRSQYDADVRSVKFIDTASGTKESPQDLFDPGIKDLRILFGQSPLFPVAPYSEGDLLLHIQRVGFRDQASITAEELLKVASEVETSERTDDTSTRAKVLFDFINKSSHLLQTSVCYNRITKPLSDFLVEKAWVSVVPTPNLGEYPDTIPWFGKDNCLFKPREVSPDSSAVLQGSIVPLVALVGVSQLMKEAFGWHRNLDHQNFVHVKRVMCHLNNVSESFDEDCDNLMYTKMISHIYAFLSEASSEHIKAGIESELSSCHWVWYGRGFTLASKVAFDGGSLRVNLDPYLFILPKSMRPYERLFSEAGVKETFPEDVLCSVLASIQEVNKTADRSQTKIDEDLSLVCDILNCISNSINAGQKNTNVLVPINSTIRNDGSTATYLTLVETQKCLYVDDERLLEEYKRSDCELPVVHPKVPIETAKQLGLLRLSHYVAPTEAIDLGYDMEGPHETTVNAIRRNLELYKEGVDIFKELIQNADDAGATEVKFLIDWRRNNDSKTTLLNKDMQSCQGPALWAYNDAQFTESDVTNICSIAAASKKRELEKVGRFGLGFTSVYHLTDVPSVVSGPFIMIFDPRTTHLRERVTPSKPGIKLDLRNERHNGTVRSFPDQFRPFQNVFGCKVLDSEHYDHTLFRLPLRTEFEATSSTEKILSDAVHESKEKMQGLLKLLKKSASTLLLFTQNIERVSVQILEENSTPDVTEEVLSVYVKRKLQLSRSIGESDSDLKTQRNLLKVAANYIPSEQSQESQDSESLEENLSSSMVLEVHRKDNIARKNNPSKKKSLFLVSACMSMGDALHKARSKEGRRAAILPCGGVAALLRTGREGLEPATIDGQAFSFLPLEISTGLPFHINGTFLLQPNRRQLWSKTSTIKDLTKEEFEIQWNICLMVDVICKALFNLLNDLKTLQAQDCVNACLFQTLWPTFEAVHCDFHPLTHGFYERLKNPLTKVILNGNKWISLQSVIFLDEMPKESAVVDAAKTLIDDQSFPKKIIEFQDPIRKSITKSGILESFKDHIYAWTRFVQDIFFPLLQNANSGKRSDEEGDEESDDDSDESEQTINPDQRDVIIQHLLDERIGATKVLDFDKLLRTVACIPVAEDQLVRPHKLIDPRSKVGQLFHKGNKRFPYGERYLTPSRLLSLSELGMLADTLDWEDICERSEAIHLEEDFKVTSFDRSVVLMGIIDQQLKQLHNAHADDGISTPTEEQKSRIQSAVFLPVANKIDGYPFAAFGKDIQFASSGEILEAKYSNLAGSVRIILDEKRLGADTMTDRLKEFLGIKDKEPSIEDVVKQLQAIMREECLADTHSTVAKICGDIYDHLQKKLCILGDNDEILHDEKFQSHVDMLRQCKFLFVDGKFVSPKQFAFRFRDHCPPYLFNVPSTLAPYTNLLKLCGVREEFEPCDFLGVVTELRNKYQDNPLIPDDVNLAHKMLQNGIDALAHTVQDEFNVPAETDECIKHSNKILLEIIKTNSAASNNQPLAVDKRGSIHGAESLTFDDMWWEDHEDLIIVHKDLTLYNARVLGIPTARQRNLQGCSSSEGFESSFGQTESLINRLQGILRDYHHVSDVMKELLQNADDAKATEIHFVYDSRSHGTEKVVDKDKWGHIQKLPALCVYNNRPFSKEDITGIQKVGVGGKIEDRSTTGRFGIGFNAVYHLTDCPTFISNNEKLCIFDPYVRYVPGASAVKPGRMYDCVSSFKDKFPDMLTGYLGDQFKLEDATMFRFPLRSKDTVQMSEQTSSISGEWYDDTKIMSLFEEFKKIAKDSMFFLKYIEHIKISRIGDDGNLKDIYNISSTISDADRELRQELSDHVQKYKDTSDPIPPMTKVYNLHIEDTEKLKEKWMVSQTVGSDKPFEMKDDQQQRGLKPQLPRGGVAALVASNRLITDRNSRWHQKRRVYSFLPLPIESNLPVHVNGSFALDSSRRHLAKSSGLFAQGDGSESCLDHPWNRYLVEDVISTAYAHLIDGAKVMLPDKPCEISNTNVDEYYSLFPSGDYGDWNVLRLKTLQCIDQLNMEVLIVLRDMYEEHRLISWHHPNSTSSLAFFDDLDGVNEVAKKRNKEIRTFLHSVKFNLVTGPLELYRAFINAGVHAACITPDHVLKHLGNNTDAITPSNLPVPLQESKYKTHARIKAVTQYCLCGRKQPLDLNNIPLLLTNDNLLRFFNTKEPVYMTAFMDLVPERGNLFMHKLIVDILWNKKDIDNVIASRVVRGFTLSDLIPYLQLHLPGEWLASETHVDWTPGVNRHPTEPWLRQLWAFVFQCGMSNPTNISWPIIPTTSSTLVLPSKAKTVLNHTPSNISHIIFGSLDCPRLSPEHIGMNDSSYFNPFLRPEETARQMFLNNTLASFENPDDVLEMFDYILDQRNLEGILNTHQSRDLLLYFQAKYAEGKYIRKTGTLKKLPIFRTSNGQLVSIDGYNNCHTCSTAIPMDEDAWRKYTSCVFLQPDTSFEVDPSYTPSKNRKRHRSNERRRLYSLLGITRIEEVDIYMRYVIPNFDMLTQSAKEKHMCHIMSTTLNACPYLRRYSFLASLSSIQWIPDANGFSQYPRYYYDPRVEVFRVMMDDTRMLPERFAKSEPRCKFLEELGLNRIVTEELFLTYAREIEIQAMNVTQLPERTNLEKKARVLLNELKCSTGRLRGNDFLKSVSEIKFIPPVDIKQSLRNIFPAYAGRKDGTGQPSFTSFSEGIASSEMELAWSVAKILPPYASIETSSNMFNDQALGMTNSAKQSYIIQHIRNVCFKMKDWNCCDVEDRVKVGTRKELIKVMAAVLRYLSSQHNQNTLMETSLIKDIPICLVDSGCVLVCANQIVFNMRKDDQPMLRPYLYQATEQMHGNRSVLEILGARSKPTLKQLTRVLAAVNDECGDSEMHPNEAKTVSTAVKLIFTELIKRGSASTKADFQEDVLYLPTTEGYLKQSTKLCSADTHLKKNLPTTLGVDFVVKLKHCGIDDAREDTKVLALLPEELRPHNLGDSMTENPCKSNKKCLAGRDCPFMQNITRCLVSEELQRALMRLLRHEKEGSRLSTEQQDGISRLKGVDKITCVQQLNIELIDNSGKCISEKPRERMVFLTNSDSNEPHIHLHHSELPVTDCLLYRELAQAIIKICGIVMDAEHFSLLREVIACTNLDRMNVLLTKADIPEYDDGTEVRTDPFAPGKRVPDKFHALLDMNPYNTFKKDEIVACIPPMQLADVEHEFDEDMETDDIPLEQEYCFARVIKEVNGPDKDGGGMKRRYRIDTGRTVEVLRGTSLFKFRRFKLPTEQTTFEDVEEEHVQETRSRPNTGLPVETVEEAHIWIKHAVEDAFTLGDDGERKAALRRLRLMWHPDKNRGQEELSTDGFKFLQQEIERLENSQL